jgi:hypothetical protein
MVDKTALFPIVKTGFLYSTPEYFIQPVDFQSATLLVAILLNTKIQRYLSELYFYFSFPFLLYPDFS